MHGLDLTFKTLASSTNEAAINVLCVAMRDSEPEVRRCALRALASRKELRCGQILLEHWPTLASEDARVIRSSAGPFISAVREALRTASEQTAAAIDVVDTLRLDALLPDLVDVAETHRSAASRQASTRVVLGLAEQLGAQARCGRDQPSVRGVATARLERSVEQLSLHRNPDLVDAFLLASTSRDSQILRLLEDGSPQQAKLIDRFQTSTLAGIAELLASFIGRSQLPPKLAAVISSREDEIFRTALLRQIGIEPRPATLHHLQRLGRPACCPKDPASANELPPMEHAALLHVSAQTITHHPKLLRWIVATVARNEPVTTTVAANVLQRSEPAPVESWIPPAVELAGNFEGRTSLSEEARLLGDLIDLLGHPQQAVVRAVQHILTPLKAEVVLPLLPQLTEQDRRRLGSILMMIDPAVIETVRDRFRHPMLPQRLEAIAAAEAFGIVDLLHEAFAHLVQNDHQDARRRAAVAMASAKGRETLAILRDMLSMPETGVRDEALRAYESREGMSPLIPGLPPTTVPVAAIGGAP